MRGERAGGSFDLRFPIKSEPGRLTLLERDQIFYVEADDSLIRTARQKLYRQSERLDQVEDRLPSPPFFRELRSYVVNLNRVRELRARSEKEWELKMNPLNCHSPISRGGTVCRPRRIEWTLN